MLLRKLQETRLVRWVAAYLAAAWLVLQVVSTLADPWNIPEFVERGIAVLLGVGVLAVATLAWYHGEKGRQSVSATEMVVILVLVAVAAGTLSLLDTGEDSLPPADGAADQVRSVAVLPFTDLSPGQDNRYFADGMTEEIISALTRAGTVRVAAKTSTFALRDQPIDVVRDTLAVSAVLEGSVRTDGDTLRVTVELVDTKDGFQIWARQFDRKRESVLQIQGEISAAIVAALSDNDAPFPATQDLIDPLAYDNYLQARYLWNRRDEAGLRQSIEFYREAIERQPDFARAYAGLADTYAVLGFYQYEAPGEAFPEADRLASRALSLDPGMAEAVATRAYVKLYYEWDWGAAEAMFREVTEAAPQYPVAHQWFTNLLVVLGRFDEARQHILMAKSVDPLSLIARSVEAWVLYYQGEYEQALQLIDRVIALDPSYMLAHYWRGWILLELGDFPAAIDALRSTVRLSGGSTITRAALARALALHGERPEAETILAELIDPSRTPVPPPYEIAKVWLALGERAAAIEWLERAYETRANQLAFIAVDPELDELHEDPAFIDIRSRMRVSGSE